VAVAVVVVVVVVVVVGIHCNGVIGVGYPLDI